MPSFTHAPLPYVGQLLPRPADRLPIGLLGRVTLITGPAGYGKSLLLSQWAEKFEGTIAWFNPVRMYEDWEVLPGVIAAVQSLLGIEEKVEPSKWQAPEVVAEEVRRLVAEFGKPFALVLDGTQFVRGTPTTLQDGFRMLVERLPSNMTVVSTSRNVPIDGAETARLLGRLDLIDEDALAIPDHVFISALMERGAQRNYASDVAKLCDGWPAAVGLVLGMPELPMNLEALRASSADRGVLRFLSDALIDRVTPELREALIGTSVAEVVSPELAISLGLSTEVSGALLTAVIQGIPAVRVDGGRAISLNPLFRDQVLDRLRRTDPLRESSLRRKYAEVLIERKDPRSIEELIALGELEAASTILKPQIPELLAAGYGPQIARWSQALDTIHSDRLSQSNHGIYMAIVEGDLVRADSLLDSFKDSLEANPKASASNHWMYFGNRAWTAFNTGDLELMREMAQSGLALDFGDHPRGEEWHDAARSYLARYKIHVSHASEVDPDIAAFFSAKNSGVVAWNDVTLPGFKAQIAGYRGEINKAISLGRLSLDNLPPNLFGTIFFPWFSLMAYAGGLREAGDAEEAVALVEKYYDDLLRFHPMGYLVDISTVYAGALADIGKMSQATGVYDELRKVVEKYGRGWWVNDRLDFQEARFLLRHGDISRAKQLAARLRDTEMLPSLTLPLDVLEAPKRAGQTLAAMSRKSPIQEMNFRLFSALLTREQPDQSDAHLKFLLSLMEEHGTMRVVVDRGREAVDLVSVYVSRHPSRFGENLVAKMQDALGMAKPSGLVAPLSKREQQILGMIATSMTLKQIADSLFVSQNTLKTHLRHLYRKMQVGGRDQAVEQGRKLLLLP